jgi:hypothetical protein
MSRRLTKTTATILVLGILLLLGATTGSAVAHEIQHAHHTAAMHSTGVCAWMCASGSGVATATVLPSVVLLIQDLLTLPDLLPHAAHSFDLLQARAPPSLR